MIYAKGDQKADQKKMPISYGRDVLLYSPPKRPVHCGNDWNG